MCRFFTNLNQHSMGELKNKLLVILDVSLVFARIIAH